jgi:8-oxo-dGTP pyrophosphatase MutT (NUDIX family)
MHIHDIHDKKDDIFYFYIDFDKCKTNYDIKYLKVNYADYAACKTKTPNIRARYIKDLKKYVCVDTDDKKSNDFMIQIINKYNIKGNCYPSISNHFRPDVEDNSHKYHYWFETDLSITSHVHINDTLLDIWGPKCEYTYVDIFSVPKKKENATSDGNDRRIIFEPCVEGMYLDTSKKYPKLTSEIYKDIMNINMRKGFFSKEEKEVPSCFFHNNCIAFEQFKFAQENGFKRDGYNPMTDYHRNMLNEYQSKNINVAVPMIDDLSRGVICCCVNVDDSKDPLIAVLRAKKNGHISKYWELPKGRPKPNESEINNAVRETREEIGIDVCKYIHKDVYVVDKFIFFGPMHIDRWKMHHDYPDESKRPHVIYYKEVKYFLAVLPEKVELKPQKVELKPQHEEVLECKWVQLSELKKIIYPNQVKMLTNFIESKKVKSKLTNSKSELLPLGFLPFFQKKPELSEKKNENVIENPNINTKKSFFSRHVKKEESKYPKKMETQESKPAFNILNPFHLFDNNKKITGSGSVTGTQEMQQSETMNKKKGLFDLVKKK